MIRDHRFHPTILREYDIRGIIDETLHDADAYAIGRSLGSMIVRAGGNSACIGYDGRPSSPGLAAAVARGLQDCGLRTIEIGCGPTPMLYYAVFAEEADGGVMVTGSHNPPNYNGFKLMLGKMACFGKDIKHIGTLAAAGDWETGEGSGQTKDLLQTYVDRMAADFDGDPLRVAWDPGNGAAGEALTALVAALPGEHTIINGEIDGSFPNHHPDPSVAENLKQLQDVVTGNGLDLGIAFDGDGDRIGVVDATGRIIWGDQILIIMARDILEQVPGATIIADVKASQALFDDIRARGGNPVMWKTGHSLIKTKMAETGAPLAGEMSGHIFYKHKYYGFDDALYAAVRFLGAISRQGGDLAAICDAMPRLVNTPELRFDCDENRKFAVVEEVVGRLRLSGARFVDVDGARVLTDDGWWLLRASNTQAVLVARCEASSEQGLERLKAELVEALGQSGIEPPEGL